MQLLSIALRSLMLLGVLSGCGPIASTLHIVDAQVELSAAKTAGAPEHAVYEYTAARAYLDKAREEEAYSDFWAAKKYADKARSLAQAARERAEQQATPSP